MVLYADLDILIVEDSPTQAEYLRKILSKYNYSCFVALSGEEALEILKLNSPKLIISDIIMPGISGYELCKIVKSNEKLKDIIFLLLTVLSDPKDIINGLEAGADGFITKPFDTNYLISTIQFLLSNHELKKFGHTESTIEINIMGKKRSIRTSQIQILNLLLSSYEQAIDKIDEIKHLKEEIEKLNKELKLLYEKDKEYDFLIEGIPIPIIIVRDVKGEIIGANSYVSYIFNIKKEDLIGKNLFETLNLEPIQYSHLRSILSSNEKKSCKVNINLPSGEKSSFEFVSIPIFYKEKPAYQVSILKT